MRQTAKVLAWLGLAVGAGAVQAGCGRAYDDLYRPLESAGADNPACAGDPSKKNVTEDCGVFVQADAADAAGKGTRDKPFKTLQQAIKEAKGRRVYACLSAPFTEAVTIAAGVELVGGFDCANGWAWSASAKSTLNGPSDAVAITATSEAKDLKIANFTIVGASATKKGASAIAVAIDDVAATLVRCDIFGGDGADGDNGVPPADMVEKGADAPQTPTMPNASSACVAGNAVFGGLPGTTMCADGVTTGGVGGKGGDPTTTGVGEPGTAGAPEDATEGLGGDGASGTLNCKDGGKGRDGDPGDHGAGGSAETTADNLSLTGVSGGDGGDGVTGKPGQGGGGGGGAKSGKFCPIGGGVFVDGIGASGAGGGAGGCGGKGGGGGKAGGSSIAILSLGANLTLTDVNVATGKGGNGGAGTIGLGGGAPGKGADGGLASGAGVSKAGCKGGNGGAGGPGGSGGGGRGGHAIGVAFAVTPTATPMLTTFTPADPGTGGQAGPDAPPTSNGTSGNAGPCWDFSQNAPCG